MGQLKWRFKKFFLKSEQKLFIKGYTILIKLHIKLAANVNNTDVNVSLNKADYCFKKVVELKKEDCLASKNEIPEIKELKFTKNLPYNTYNNENINFDDIKNTKDLAIFLSNTNNSDYIAAKDLALEVIEQFSGKKC